MARLKLEIHLDAALELERSYEYYASRSFIAADAFLHEIDSALEGIRENPLLWPRYLERYRRRVLTRFPFSIVYIGHHDNLSQANQAMKTDRRPNELLRNASPSTRSATC